MLDQASMLPTGQCEQQQHDDRHIVLSESSESSINLKIKSICTEVVWESGTMPDVVMTISRECHNLVKIMSFGSLFITEVFLPPSLRLSSSLRYPFWKLHSMYSWCSISNTTEVLLACHPMSNSITFHHLPFLYFLKKGTLEYFQLLCMCASSFSPVS